VALRPLKRTSAGGEQFPAAILDSLSEAIVVVDGEARVQYANLAAEQFFGAGRARLVGHPMTEFVPADSPFFSLLEQVLASGGAVAENGVTLASPRIGNRFCAVRLSPIVESDGLVAVSLIEQSIARNIDRQMSHRSAARSVSALAAMLAHEVKNPLSGIRGAAQLLEQSVPDSERELTNLICEETDRIVALVDRMEAFADGPADRSRRAQHPPGAQSRAAYLGERLRQNVRFIESYDPSLPDVFGDRDQLIQVFLNLVKNACEVLGDASARSSCRPPIAMAAARRAGPAGAREPAAGRFRARQRPRRIRRDPLPSVRCLRHQQADRYRTRPGAGGEDHQRPWRRHRIRQRARPDDLPRDAAPSIG